MGQEDGAQVDDYSWCVLKWIDLFRIKSDTKWKMSLIQHLIFELSVIMMIGSDDV